MALYYQPHPTMTDLKGRLGLNVDNRPSIRDLGGPGARMTSPGISDKHRRSADLADAQLADSGMIALVFPSEWLEPQVPLLPKLEARKLGYKIPELMPPDATVAQLAAFNWLLDIDLIGLHLASTYQNILGQLARDKVTACAYVNRYNALAREFARLQQAALVQMMLAGIRGLPTRPTIPPVFVGVGLNRPGDDGLIPCGRPDGLIGAAASPDAASGIRVRLCGEAVQSELGAAPLVLLAWAGLALAVGIGGSLLFHNWNAEDIAAEKESTKRTLTLAEVLDKQTAIALEAMRKCKSDECIVSVMRGLEATVGAIRGAFADLRPDKGTDLTTKAVVAGAVVLAVVGGIYVIKSRSSRDD